MFSVLPSRAPGDAKAEVVEEEKAVRLVTRQRANQRALCRMTQRWRRASWRLGGAD
jgi:hypothetical protein